MLQIAETHNFNHTMFVGDGADPFHETSCFLLDTESAMLGS